VAQGLRLFLAYTAIYKAMFAITYEARVRVIEPVVECECLQGLEEVCVVGATRVCLYILVQTVLLGAIHV
jgi:hypothetical protein